MNFGDELSELGKHYSGVVSCPDCGCIEQSGFPRCPECGLFHSQIAMEQRDVPTKSTPAPKKEILDPSAYSMTANAEIPDEVFEESDEITQWKGGSTSFSFDDSDDPPVRKIVQGQDLPKSEEL